ncbi:Chemotaxis protein CheY [uncultured archaeon]|nr:Chemotaxis protein CheY [uncultured archaeon]
MQIKKNMLDDLEKQYASALADYLAGGGETALEHAYELGRKAIADGLGILDLATAHQKALVRVLPRVPQESAGTITKAAQFFAESIAPFEMTFRGFQESMARLHEVNRTLEQSEMKFRSVVQAANDAIISSDSNGKIISWNKGAQTIFGYAEKEVLGESVTILMPEKYRDIHSRYFEHFRSTGKSRNEGRTQESSGLRKDGSEFPVEISVTTWKTEEGTFFTCVLRDITERKKALEKIREQAALLDKAQDAIAVRDLEHRIIYWNKGAQSLYGWTEEEALGKNANELLYKEQSSGLIEARKTVIAESEWKGELRQVTKDGHEIIVDSRWTLVRDNEGKPESILIINTDITEKKKLESQLLRAQRMDSIGTLAGGLAHDLNNMLTPIMLSLQLLKEKANDEQSRKLLDILENNSRRGADLIKQVMSFARGIEGERNTLQAKHIIDEIEKVAKETFPKEIEIRTDIQNDLLSIAGDATQLHQVILNLCVNARDAMPDGGTLSITASNFCIDENYARMHNEAKIGPYISITVTDTGTGIPPGIFDRIFEPFFTTKELGKGTGLGLSTALGIVRGHGGFINVYSEVGKGTTFSVYLPAIKTEMQNVEERQLELFGGQGELVLVAEDEDSVRDITASTLEKYGYNVLAANDGADAVALYAKNKNKINVILMDMMMSVMDGIASIRAIHKINPEARIIAVSGLAEKDRLAKVADFANVFLPKPYTAEKLLKTIHEVLGAK